MFLCVSNAHFLSPFPNGTAYRTAPIPSWKRPCKSTETHKSGTRNPPQTHQLVSSFPFHILRALLRLFWTVPAVFKPGRGMSGAWHFAGEPFFEQWSSHDKGLVLPMFLEHKILQNLFECTAPTFTGTLPSHVMVTPGQASPEPHTAWSWATGSYAAMLNAP